MNAIKGTDIMLGREVLQNRDGVASEKRPRILVKFQIFVIFATWFGTWSS